MFINVGNIPITEEEMIANITKSYSFQEGKL